MTQERPQTPGGPHRFLVYPAKFNKIENPSENSSCQRPKSRSGADRAWPSGSGNHAGRTLGWRRIQWSSASCKLELLTAGGSHQPAKEPLLTVNTAYSRGWGGGPCARSSLAVLTSAPSSPICHPLTLLHPQPSRMHHHGNQHVFLRSSCLRR